MGIKREAERYLAETGKNATAKELADRLGVSEEDVIRCSEAGGVVSLDGAADREGENVSLYDVIPAEENVFEDVENRDAVRAALASLSETERKLVMYRFGKELSQMETAKRMGVSQMNVSRMERKILQKLKENLKKTMVE